MTNDALDPGPLGDFPHVPRLPDGSIDRERFPTGEHVHRRKKDGKEFVVDMTPHRDNDPREVPVDYEEEG